MSAVADALGARDGAVLADTPGIGFNPELSVCVIRPVSRQRAVEAFLQRAAALGYRASESGAPLGGPPGRILHFERSPVLPDISARILEPGEPMLLPMVDPGRPALRFVVPEGGCGMLVPIELGLTALERPRPGEAEAPAVAARRHLSGLGVDTTPPPARDLRWRWWRRRRAFHRRLTHTARRIGAYRGRVVSVWYVGSAIGPYTHAVATIQRGDPAQAAQRILDSAQGLACATSSFSGTRHDHCPADLPRLSVLTYRPGERMAIVSSTLHLNEPRSAVTVPQGHAGLLVGLTSTPTRSAGPPVAT